MKKEKGLHREHREHRVRRKEKGEGGFMAQKTCDAKPYLAARTPLGMTQCEDGGLGGVEVVPRSLRCATAEGAVAPVPSRLRTSGMTIVRRTGKVVRGVKLAARLRRRTPQGQERPKSEEKRVCGVRA